MTSAGAASSAEQTLAAALSTRWLGRALRLVGEATSTIDIAKEWIDGGAPHGAVVIAERQTQGRGRGSRRWASPRGGLWMSIIVKMEADKAGRLGMALAVAAAEAVSAETGCEVGLKWPNDLILEGRKVGGVLGQTAATFGGTAVAVVSLGLNADLSMDDLPEELREVAATLREAMGTSPSLPKLTAAILGRFEEMWSAVEGEDMGRVVDGWRRRDVLAGREVSLDVAGKMVRGRAGGIDETGALIVASDGTELTVSAGEVVSTGEASP